MREKIFVLIMMLLITSTSIIIPRDINVKATDNHGDLDLDHGYILNQTYNLSQIVFYPD
jgi:hypothetical protein